jgi:release factor glutamine methyltransferase
MAAFLGRHGLPQAQADAELLLRFACGKQPASAWLAHRDEPVGLRERWRAWALALRRARHEPMAYLLGHRSFFGRAFFVHRSTLIPRPESECLVEAALALPAPDLIADIGCGSGALGITLALECGAPAIGVELSWAACRLARKNALALQADFTVRRGSLFALTPADCRGVERLLMVANLPYLNTTTLAASPREVRAWEPTRALVSDHADGLNLYRTLFSQIEKARRNPAWPTCVDILIELDPHQASAAATFLPDASVTPITDLGGHVRGLHYHLRAHNDNQDQTSGQAITKCRSSTLR